MFKKTILEILSPPRIFLEAFGLLFEQLDVRIAAFGLAVEKLRQKCHDTELLAFARFFDDALRRRLFEFRRRQILGRLRRRPRDDVARRAAAVVVDRVGGGRRAGREEFYGWKTANAEFVCFCRVHSRVERAEHHFAVELSSGRLPVWLKIFAMAAPTNERVLRL